MSTTDSWLFPDRAMDDFIRAQAGRAAEVEDAVDRHIAIAAEAQETLDRWVAAGIATQEAVDAFAAQLTPEPEVEQ